MASSTSWRPRGGADSRVEAPLAERGLGPEAGGQSGDTEGLSREELAVSESVEELLEEGQADRLKAAGLDFYNHNLDTSREKYGEIITTRVYEDRLRTLANVRRAGISVCCGGILGMGESVDDRCEMLRTLAAQELQIFIGTESGIRQPDLAIVAAPYRLKGEVVGALGVIGPTRMDYSRVVPLVELTARTVGLTLDDV